jgi:hypothetical protein
MKNNKVPIIVMMSTNMFVDKLEDIRGICKQCKAKEVLDDAVDIILFYFNDNEL